MKWHEALEIVIESLGRGIAYKKGREDALERRGRAYSYLPDGGTLKSDEQKNLYAQGFQDGVSDRPRQEEE